MLGRTVGCLVRRGLWRALQLIKANYAAKSATFNLKPYKIHRLKKAPAAKMAIDAALAKVLYTQMQTIRRMENGAATLYKDKVVRGFCHLYSGQEAVAVGMKSVMRANDSAITSYRAHGWTYLMGAKPLEVLAELTGRKSGVCRGKGGSMHMYAKNFYGGNGIVGAQVPLGAGVAFANQYKKEDSICFTLYGDGAANQGQVSEVHNMAMLWKLPAVFVCENNGYAMGTSVERSSADVDYFKRGDLLPGLWVDGMDVLTVRAATQFAIEHVRAGNGPLIIEFATYRYAGHSMSDPGTSYRSRSEVQEVRKTKDPISKFKEKIVGAKLVTEDEIKKIDLQIKKEIDNAVAVARTDTVIPIEELANDIYANNLQSSIRGNTMFKNYSHKNTLGVKPYNLKT